MITAGVNVNGGVVIGSPLSRVKVIENWQNMLKVELKVVLYAIGFVAMISYCVAAGIVGTVKVVDSHL